MKTLAISIFTLVCISLTFASDKLPSAVDDYTKSLKSSRSQKNVSIESTYIKGLMAMNSLEELLGQNESELNSKWLKNLRTKMEGFDINPNTETFVASPKYVFFLNLAKQNGKVEDVAFFELTKKTYPNGSWPVCIEQRTDVTGCTVYDGTLTKMHKEWNQFQNNYPKAYIKITTGQIANIEQELSESNCSCTEKVEPVINELQTFIKENSKSKLISKIQKRIKDIKSKTAPIPGCKAAG